MSRFEEPQLKKTLLSHTCGCDLFCLKDVLLFKVALKATAPAFVLDEQTKSTIAATIT